MKTLKEIDAEILGLTSADNVQIALLIRAVRQLGTIVEEVSYWDGDIIPAGIEGGGLDLDVLALLKKE